MYSHLFASAAPAKDYAEYHAETLRLMSVIGDVIGEDKLVSEFHKAADYSSISGRGGSTIAEGCIKKLIVKHKTSILAKANSVDGYTLLDIIDYASTSSIGTDAAARTFADIAVVMENKQGVLLAAPVNIKFTNGSTADNIGGWSAFEYMLTGSTSGTCSEGKLMERMSYKLLEETDVASDYFIMSFTKDAGQRKLFTKQFNFSLLQFDPKEFTYNRSQSFPFQANSSKIAQKQASTAPSILQRRLDWVNNLNAKDAIRLKKMVANMESRIKLMKNEGETE